MYTLWQPFFARLAQSDDSRKDHIIQYLKTELEIARAHLPERIALTPQEKQRLVDAGKPLGSALKQLITLVSYRTFLRWLAKTEPDQPPSSTGRPPIDERLRELILRISKQVGCGYARILGELKKLGLGNVSKSTIKNILKDHNVDPAPIRGVGTWAAFVERHKETLWACDFLQTKIWTMTGLTDFFLFFFIHIGSRRVYLAGITANPTQAWVAEQAQKMAAVVAQHTSQPQMLIRDLDSKFSRQFDDTFAVNNTRVLKVGPKMPNKNAHMERWIQSFEFEALNHFIVFGEKHLAYIANTYIAWYNTFRPHQGLDNRPIPGPTLAVPPEDWTPDDVVIDETLGGVLHHCHWKNAA